MANGKDADQQSDSDNRLPRNAHPGGSGSGGKATPQSIRGSVNMAKATEKLATSIPSSFPRASHLDDVAAIHSASSDAGDSDAASARLASSPARLDANETARRLRRHLVTRARDSVASSARGSIGANSRLRQDLDDDDEGGYVGDINDDEVGDREVVDPLTLPSGDITHGIYKWQKKHSPTQSSVRARRRESFSGMASDSDWDLGVSRSQLRAPGGMRRHFVQDRAEREGRQVDMLTDSFVDFIGLYGHFAGGDYPSDEDDEETEEGERAPLLTRQRSARDIHATASSRKAFFLLVKAFVGTGVLVLPKAFSNGGLLASAFVMTFVAWYAWHCMILLADVYLKIGGSYSDLGNKLYGGWMRNFITVSIVLAQLGFCSAYTIFIATNMRDLWNVLTKCRFDFSPGFWVLIQLLAYIPLSWVRKIKKLAPFALAANLFIVVGLGYVLFYDIMTVSEHGIADVVQFNPVRFPLLIGTAVFAYEGVTLVIPVLDSMTHQEKFPMVLTSALCVCVCVCVLVGSLSYLAFGEEVETVVLLNLPTGSLGTICVQLFYSLAIMLSVPLQLFPAVRIVEANLFAGSGKGDPFVKWQKNLFRAATVVLIALVAVFGADQFDNFIAIIGAFSCTPLSFIFPTALHYKTSESRWVKIKDVVLGFIGVVIMVYVTYIGIMSWGVAPPPIDRCATKP